MSDELNKKRALPALGHNNPLTFCTNTNRNAINSFCAFLIRSCIVFSRLDGEKKQGYYRDLYVNVNKKSKIKSSSLEDL